MAVKRILLVEDDIPLAKLMEDCLQQEDYQVHLYHDGNQACEAIDSQRFDLAVLDLMLPGRDGLEICRHLRKTSDIPVLILTAKEDDMVAAASLQLGVDNYLQKPVRPHLLLAHLEALLRRGKLLHQTVQDILIHAESYSASLKGEPLDLTSGEYELLAYLASRAGDIITRDELYREIRGFPFDGIDRSLDLRISKLRKKLKDDQPPYRYIKTVRSTGYLISL